MNKLEAFKDEVRSSMNEGKENTEKMIEEKVAWLNQEIKEYYFA